MVYAIFKKGKGKNGKEQDALEKIAEEKRPQIPPRRGSSSKAPSAPAAEPVGQPLLDDNDESFFERLTSEGSWGDEADDGPPPPLPPRVKTPVIEWEKSDDENDKEGGLGRSSGEDALTKSAKDSGEGSRPPLGGEKPKNKRFSFFARKRDTQKGLEPEHLAPVTKPEAEREKDDLTRVLDDLNLSARNNHAFSLSAESAELVGRFTLVLKDLVNGVPTAAGDLQALLDDRNGTLARTFEKLPSSLKKLVTQLPNKMTSTLAPELLAVAAEAQGLSAAAAAGGAAGGSGGMKAAAKKLFTPHNFQELVTKPGAIVSMLKAIMNALKLRWPAFLGTNVIWSVAIFLLLLVLWYCHKRGRETRLEKEQAALDGARMEELPNEASAGQFAARTQ